MSFSSLTMDVSEILRECMLGLGLSPDVWVNERGTVGRGGEIFALVVGSEGSPAVEGFADLERSSTTLIAIVSSEYDVCKG